MPAFERRPSTSLASLTIVTIAMAGLLASGCGLIEDLYNAKPASEVTVMTHPPGEAPATESIPTQPVGQFLTDRWQMIHNPAIPFQLAWLKPGIDLKTYSDIMIAPVTVAYLRPMQPGETIGADQQNKAAVDAALHMPEAFAAAVKARPTQHLQVTDTAEPTALILEIAIVQLTPQHQLPPSPVAENDKGADAQKELQKQQEQNLAGTIGLDVRILDGGSKEPIAMLSDIRKAPTNAADSAWGFTTPVVDRWALDLVSIL